MSEMYNGLPGLYEETNGGRHSKLDADFTGIGQEALYRLAKIIHEGAVSHNDPDGENWRRIPCEVHINHALYHINCYLRGEGYGLATGEDHLGHAMCRLVMACEVEGHG